MKDTQDRFIDIKIRIIRKTGRDNMRKVIAIVNQKAV